MQQIGKLVMMAGGFLLLTGFLLWVGGNHLKWLGRLPGDIRIQKPGFNFYFPITTMILISVLLSFILWLVRKVR